MAENLEERAGNVAKSVGNETTKKICGYCREIIESGKEWYSKERGVYCNQNCFNMFTED